MKCGCFCCLQVFEASEVVDWIHDGDTPPCLRCGIGAVLPGETNMVALLSLRLRCFGPHAGAPLTDEET